MSEKIGIQETKEVLVAVNEVALLLIKHFKDGVQVADVAAIVGEVISKEEFRACLAKAFENVAKVPEEVKDFGIEDAMELVKEEIAFIPKVIAALK